MMFEEADLGLSARSGSSFDGKTPRWRAGAGRSGSSARPKELVAAAGRLMGSTSRGCPRSSRGRPQAFQRSERRARGMHRRRSALLAIRSRHARQSGAYGLSVDLAARDDRKAFVEKVRNARKHPALRLAAQPSRLIFCCA